MKYCLVADDGQARVVAYRNTLRRIKLIASIVSSGSTAKWHICRREPSEDGHYLVTLETWEKGVKL